ncbi:hypothetical protein GCM10010377_67880 [Streptomyces viridiviolaceus]|uniref:Dehydrogenase n=1 Tax=Streptomyces viridiviolaceus TaxID=68282 RepID=A0ABW2E7L5_9ACTN|nr:hypothetical protein [Streptomyces viridiviolaceus]GHB67410.1 hypothetical protein GCM10010377_67880 [Streptomyces viridiviolaceus]
MPSAQPEPMVTVFGTGPSAAAYGRGLRHYDIAHTFTDPALLGPEPDPNRLRRALRDSGDVVVTVPAAPQDLWWSTAALGAGRHCYEAENPYQDPEGLRELGRTARSRGLLAGTGPDTFLGSTVRGGQAALAEDVVGTVHGARVWFGGPDPEQSRASARSVVDAVLSLFGDVTVVESVPEPAGSPGDAARPVCRLHTARGPAVEVYAAEDDQTARGTLVLDGTGGQVRLNGLRHYDRPLHVRLHEDEPWRDLDLGMAPTTDQAGALFRGPGVHDLIRALDGGAFAANVDRAAAAAEATALLLAAIGTGATPAQASAAVHEGAA